ncbi:MAG TPA: acyl-CoA carboxylase subunit epsilon [Microbacterium sp.]|nr:acyl-CoA carboxylase subunit epsilon [Microbacterium sp.]
MSAGVSAGQGAAGEELAIEVRSGSPTEVELAALIAVVTEAYAEEAAGTLADDEQHATAWSLTQRGLRQPLRRDLGWGRYAG